MKTKFEDEGLDHVERLEAGVTSPVFFEVPGVPPRQTMDDVHRHLIPYFSRTITGGSIDGTSSSWR
jgi:hypothetical protein